MIEVEHLTKSYGAARAVNDISFKVERGEILGFLGPNGAGKTTTMRILTGYLPASSGSVRVAGFDVFNSGRTAQSGGGAPGRRQGKGGDGSREEETGGEDDFGGFHGVSWVQGLVVSGISSPQECGGRKFSFQAGSVFVLVTVFLGGSRTGAAEGGIVAALGAVVLHRVGRLALHHGDFPGTVFAGVLGADFGPAGRALLVGPIGFELRQLDRFARAADQGHRVAGFHGLGFFLGLDAPGVPVLEAGTGEGGGSGDGRDNEQGRETEGLHDE